MRKHRRQQPGQLVGCVFVIIAPATTTSSAASPPRQPDRCTGRLRLSAREVPRITLREDIGRRRAKKMQFSSAERRAIREEDTINKERKGKRKCIIDISSFSSTETLFY